MTDRDDPTEDPLEETRAFDPFADPQEDQSTRRIDRPVAENDATQRFGTVPLTPDSPRTERIALAPQRQIAGWLIALIVVVALGIGVAVGYQQRQGGNEGVQARALVGPNGGVLDFADGAGKLEIPPGALPTATAITVRMVGNENRIRIGAVNDPAAVVYEPGELQMFVFEPAGLNLQVPAKITLPRPADGSALLVHTPDGPRVVGANMQGDKVIIETSSFAFEDL